ncbi:hypothetical protein PGT21_025921 [Puccinia graminis f. sp. tritici]|uniref:Fungal-type protein kinase domain-containing protein n=2 Tax=Puccinia graminis f. sp. tritici TaxID=56615 RepID=A0A5B0NVZ9_PUCGR|nr:hypothetical protein PGT21_025921 [Puccinia graminis f. sp. tritici]
MRRSSTYPIVNRQERHARIGTKVFMSASLLTQSNPGEVVDDLESFFWVLVWICTCYASHQPKETAHQNWGSHHPTELGAIKIDLLFRPDWITQEFTPRNQS